MPQDSQQSKQSATDISNLRFYSAMAHDFKWQTDIIHWSVISKTLEEIANRLAAVAAENHSTVKPPVSAGDKRLKEERGRTWLNSIVTQQ